MQRIEYQQGHSLPQNQETFRADSLQLHQIDKAAEGYIPAEKHENVCQGNNVQLRIQSQILVLQAFRADIRNHPERMERIALPTETRSCLNFSRILNGPFRTKTRKLF